MGLVLGDWIAVATVLLATGTLINQLRIVIRDMEGMKKTLARTEIELARLTTSVTLQLQTGAQQFQHLQTHIEDHEKRIREIENRVAEAGSRT